LSNFSIFEKAPKIVNIDQHLALKKYILFFAAVFIATAAKAQSGYNYMEWGLGGGVSYERGYTNITTQFNHPGFNLNVVYNYNPYLPVEAEIQIGQLSGGGIGPGDTYAPKLDPYGRKYTNNYKALIVHADFQLGTAIDYGDDWFLNIAKNLYLGSGLGLIVNNNTVQRTAPNHVYVFPGKDNSIDFMLPIRFGYEYKIFDDYNEPAFAIDATYIHTFAFGEGLDGYNDPSSKFKNNSIDQYRQFNITFKYYFGRVVSYNKLIRDFH
jgi:hypothetical protein